uniref:Uncharacterized protein n=1 Tax=Octopus bimaculoides TaxID=37653 RepID=A0A0L8G6J0_OCTBM
MGRKKRKQEEKLSDWATGALVGGVAAAVTVGAIWLTGSYFSNQSTVCYSEDTAKRNTDIIENEKGKETHITETSTKKAYYSQTNETRCDFEKKPIEYNQDSGMTDLLQLLFK